MPKNIDHIRSILIKKGVGEPLTPEELTILREWEEESTFHQELSHQVSDTSYIYRELKALDKFPSDRVWSDIQRRVSPSPMVVFTKYATAALVIGLLVMIGLKFWPGAHSDPGHPWYGRLAQKNWPGAPKDCKAMISTADNSYIIVDTISLGETLALPGYSLKKIGQDSLVFTSIPTDNPAFQILSLLQSSPMHVSLPDGSQVTLNYSSSLSFKIVDNEHIRQLVVVGDATFDVAQDSRRPFIVYANDIKVEVLGTKFRVRAYSGEPVREVTLLNGKIRLTAGKISQVLDSAGRAIVKGDNIDIHPSGGRENIVPIVWKEDLAYLHCDSSSTYDIVTAVARWYQLQPVMDRRFKAHHISGDILLHRRVELTLSHLTSLDKDFNTLRLSGDSLVLGP